MSAPITMASPDELLERVLAVNVLIKADTVRCGVAAEDSTASVLRS